MKKQRGYYSVFESINVNEMKSEQENYHIRRCEKRKLYQAFSRYIRCLEEHLEKEKDVFKRNILKLEILKVKRMQKRCYDPSILERANYGLMDLNISIKGKQNVKKLIKN